MCLIEIRILPTQDSPLPLPLRAGLSGSRCFRFPLIGLQRGCCSFSGKSWENYFLHGFNCLHSDFAFRTIRAQASCSPPPISLQMGVKGTVCVLLLRLLLNLRLQQQQDPLESWQPNSVRPHSAGFVFSDPVPCGQFVKLGN